MPRRIREAALGALLVALGAGRARACGPDFPNRLLLEGDEAFARMPAADFCREVARIVRPEDPAIPQQIAAFPAGDLLADLAAATAEAELRDLGEALAEAGMPADRRLEAARGMRALRDAMAGYARDLRDWRERGPAPASNPRPAPPAWAVPEGLPGEFREYLQGAIAFHEGRLDDARGTWRALLDRPAGERRRRSVWAAFMMGKANLAAGENEAAIGWFEQTRALAKEGFADSLDLAGSSAGWQARAELRLGRFEAAIGRYLDRLAAGDTFAAMSLREVAERIFEAGPEALRRAAADERSRRVLAAYVVSRGGPYSYGPDKGLSRAWLAAVEAAGVRDAGEADRLAWAAYEAGDMEGARRWLDRAPAASPIAAWIRSKLLLREGKLDEAAAFAARAAAGIPREERWVRNAAEEVPYGRPAFRPALRAQGELGALRLSQGRFAEALDALLRGGFWTDAAYVAERVLTADELKAYVDREWPGGRRGVPGETSTDDRFGPPLATMGVTVRHLLARRLVRIGRLEEARPYFPEDLRPDLDEYAAALREARDPAVPERRQADAFWRAAQAARSAGLALMATEEAPDWAEHEGRFWDGPASETRRQSAGRLLPVSGAETQRLGTTRVRPEKRWHYRYVAADLAWEAAARMPDEDPETAKVLAIAGGWIQNDDPKAADRFYKALVRRCGGTPLGREADRRRWFPELDKAGNVVVASGAWRAPPSRSLRGRLAAIRRRLGPWTVPTLLFWAAAAVAIPCAAWRAWRRQRLRPGGASPAGG